MLSWLGGLERDAAGVHRSPARHLPFAAEVSGFDRMQVVRKLFVEMESAGTDCGQQKVGAFGQRKDLLNFVFVLPVDAGSVEQSATTPKGRFLSEATSRATRNTA